MVCVTGSKTNALTITKTETTIAANPHGPSGANTEKLKPKTFTPSPASLKRRNTSQSPIFNYVMSNN